MQPEVLCVACGGPQRRRFHYRNHEYWRCVGCGLMSTYPLPDAAAIEAHYAKKFREGNYELLRKFSVPYLEVYRHFVNILEARLLSSRLRLEESRILDVGCFTGDFLQLLVKKGAREVYGLELQREAVEIANQKLPGRVFQADVLGENFPAFPCEAVTLLGLIEHVLDPVALLKRAHGLLKPGGVLMIQTPDSGSLLAHFLGRYWPPYAPIEHIHLFSRKSMARTLEGLGFADVSFVSHWKRLPIAYVYENLRNFGPEFRRILGSVYRMLPGLVIQKSLPFYVGEMIVVANKSFSPQNSGE